LFIVAWVIGIAGRHRRPASQADPSAWRRGRTAIEPPVN
jgi:hypothetical protein